TGGAAGSLDSRMIPTASCPNVIGAFAPVSGCSVTGTTIGPFRYSSTSVPQIPQASISILTQPSGTGSGTGTVSTRTSRRPHQRSAVIVCDIPAPPRNPASAGGGPGA